MTDEFLTRVEIAFYPEYLNHRLRFGVPVLHVVLDRRRAAAFFRPSQVFGYLRWSANAFGTSEWRLTIIAAAMPSLLLSRVPGLWPGGEVLLLLEGKARVRKALALLDALEAEGYPLHDISPAYYRHMHVRILTGRDVRAYSQAQHQAHLAARKVHQCGA